VVLCVARDWRQQPLSRHDLTLGGIMAAASVIGAVIVARQAHRLSVVAGIPQGKLSRC